MGNNNFNICPRCGSANSSVAKFCFQCGAQLKATEQPVVCGKCKTVNSANSTYCKSCGTLLAEGANSKICPRCNSYVANGATICAKCGYSFVGATQIQPVANPSGAVLKPPKRIKAVPVGATKARAGGLIRLALALVLMYFLIMPAFMEIPSLDYGIYAVYQGGQVGQFFNGYDIIVSVLQGLSSGGAAFLETLTPNQWIIYILFAVTLLVLVVEFFSGLARLLNGRLLKKKNGFMLFLFITGLIATVYLVLSQNAPAIAASAQEGLIKNIFTGWSAISTTWLSAGYYVMIGYYFAVFILSLIFRKPVQQVRQIGR